MSGREDFLAVFSCDIKNRDLELPRITLDSIRIPRASDAVE